MRSFYIKLFTFIVLFSIPSISQWRDFSVPYFNEDLNSICITSNLNMFGVGGNKLTSWHIGGPPPDYYEFDINSNFNSIYFPDDLNGFVVGMNSNYDSGILIKSTDGGNTWTNEIQILGPSDLNDVFFINNSVGWIAGHYYAGDQAIIGKSTDGGITWSASTIPYIESGEFYATHFADENIGWAVGTGDGLGFGKIIKTTDSGNNWIDQPVSITGTINDLHFLNGNVGWICTSNGEILKSSDGGTNWISQYSNSESINSISFLDENSGWSVGNNGLILYTTNGGLNWLVEASNTSTDLNSIFTSSNLPYGVCGNAGKFMLREIFTVSNAFTPMDGSSAVGDYDNDGDLDIALTGVMVTSRPHNRLQVDERYCEIYRNNGNGNFTYIPTPLTKVGDGGLDWGDYDNDGDLDLLLSGYYEDDSTSTDIFKIYRNDGNDKFIEVLTSFNVFGRGFQKWGDLDNDGDLDIMSSAGIYSNEGGDSFVEKPSALSELGFAAGTLGDMDNDGDLDIIAGLENSTPKIFRNDGHFSFTEIALPPPTKLDYFDLSKLNADDLERYNSFFENSGSSAYYGSCDLGDYDNDGDLDILWIQTSYSANGTIIYRNDGNDNYTELTNTNLPGLMLGSGVFIDYDNDGDLDVFLSGGNTYNDAESGIYRNDGSDTFVQVPFYYGEWETISWSSTNSGDFDNDGDVDLLVVGEKYGLQGAAYIYSNNCLFPSSLPTAPSNLQSQINYGDVTLNWNKSSDNETPQVALNYNIYLGTSPNNIDIVSPMSVLSNGHRGLVNQGNTNQNNSWTIKGLSPGTYYWSVQAIDNNFAGSLFAGEQSFTIEDPSTIDFALELNVSDNCVNNINLQLGTAADATDGYDASYDQLAPPEPPAGAFDGRLRNTSGDYFKDFRATNISTTVIWTVIERPANSCSPVTVSWDPVELPVYGFFSLVDGVTGGSLVNVDMRLTNSFTDNIGLGNLQVVFKYTNTMTISILNGWNMLSLPLVMEDAHYPILFPNAAEGSMYGFNGAYYSTDVFESEKTGYWLNFPGSETVTLEGVPINNTSILLNAGWNLIGSIFCDVPLSSINDPGGIVTAGTLYGFDGAYYSAGSITKGQAYWLRADSSGTISFECGDQILPKTTAKGGAETLANIESSLSGFSKIEVMDGNEITSTLYFSGNLDEAVDKESYSLPPVAPAGVFDVRLNGGYKLVEEDEVLVKVQSNKYPVKINIDSNGKLSGKDGYMVKGLSGGIEISSDLVKDKQELVITDSRINTLRIQKGELIPVEYSLEQNYPNPFNPSTTIKFSLPESARVRVKIYSVLGELITDLIDTDMEAGYHNIEFNASGLASGVYLYRIETQKFNEVKKMVLMK